MKRAILFDCGGTLDGDGHHWLDQFASAYGVATIDVSAKQLSEAFQHSTHAAYACRQVQAFGLRSTIDLHVAAQFEFLGLHQGHHTVAESFEQQQRTRFAFSRTILKRLAATGRYRLGVVSNFYGNVANLLSETGISPLLDTIIDSSVVGVAKPDPAIFAIALNQLNILPADSVYVGDSFSKDVIGATAAGIDCIWVRPAGTSCPDPRLPAAEIESLAELVERFG